MIIKNNKRTGIIYLFFFVFLISISFASADSFGYDTDDVVNSPFGYDTEVTDYLIANNIYGEMWYHNHTATPLNFLVGNVFYNLTFSKSNVNGFIFNDADDNLEAQFSGRYLANYMASGDGQNNHIYYTSIFVNGVSQNSSESHKKMSAGGDIVTMTGSGFIDLIAGDRVNLATADIGGTGIGNYYSSNLNLVRIGL